MDDYISRDKAAKVLCMACGNAACDPFECSFYKVMEDVPAADVRPVVRARWEDETGYIFSNLAQRVYCPACKSYAYFYPITAKNFCPNCGADMRKVKSDEK